MAYRSPTTPVNDPNLYFSTAGPVTVHAAQPLACPLGQIIYAGTKWNSLATYGHAPPPGYMRPTPHYLLVLTLEGEADYMDSTGVRTVLRPGSLMWTCPGVEQSYGPRPGMRWSEFFLWFAGPLFDTWQQGGYPGEQSRHLTLAPPDAWFKRFLAIVQPELRAPPEPDLLRLCHLQTILASALQTTELDRRSAEEIRWRDEACYRLAHGTVTAPPLQAIARELNVSYSLFRKRFLALTGQTPGQYRTAEILRRASVALLESNDPIKAIAADLGFHDAFHFSRRFKEHTGMSPSEFRRQAQPGAPRGARVPRLRGTCETTGARRPGTPAGHRTTRGKSAPPTGRVRNHGGP